MYLRGEAAAEEYMQKRLFEPAGGSLHVFVGSKSPGLAVGVLKREDSSGVYRQGYIGLREDSGCPY